MVLPGVNAKDEGVVTSNAFNITRLTGVLALLIGGGATISGATSQGNAEDGWPDWANFTQDQRLVIIVAVIAAWAVVTASDILGRSYATGHSNHDAPVLLTPIAAKKITEVHNARDIETAGAVVAVRPGAPVTFLWQPSEASATAEWVEEKLIKF